MVINERHSPAQRSISLCVSRELWRWSAVRARGSYVQMIIRNINVVKTGEGEAVSIRFSKSVNLCASQGHLLRVRSRQFLFLQYKSLGNILLT